MRKWLFIGLVVVGLLAFAAVIWFAGPFLGFGDFAPLESEWVRFTIIAVVWLAAGLFYGIRFFLRRRAAKKLEEGLLAADNDGDSGVLSERMGEALETLKQASGRSDYLYSLPWYIIIGPPGAGKTTALLKSGLKFPLAGADGGAAVAGTGGTRYCDWWFTDEAVLIDTAGRYTTQDSDAQSDKKSWLAFLKLLKRNRPRQPINGVIVAISLSDVMTLSEADLALHSAAIRKRLIEVHQELKIDFPVYALFTKADLVVGFNEYFGNFTESRRRKVWGATFQTESRRKNLIGEVPAEYDALVRRLTEELPDRLQEEPDAVSRIGIFGFPAQFAMLRSRVYDFLRQIFEPNRYQVDANLRGFYFSSGTQEGTPIDQVLGAMDRSFGGQGQGQRQMSGLGKSYFLHDLITQVIFSETGWVSMDMAAVRRSAVFRYGTMGAIGLAVALALGAWAWSYTNNRNLIDSTNSFVATYSLEAAEQLKETTISDFDLLKVLPSLNMLAGNPVGYEHRSDAVPVEETFGLSQRQRLVAASEASYRQALERMLRSRLILRLENQLQDSIDDPRAAYEALKVYLMIGGGAPKVDTDYIIAWMKADWERNLYSGAHYSRERGQLEEHLRAMLALDIGRAPTFELNQLLIDSARRTLTRLSIAEQAYGYLESLALQSPLPDFRVAERAGVESSVVFEATDGSDFNALSVPALFTYRGFHELFLPQLGSIAEKLVEEKWVRGELAPELSSDAELRKLGPKLLEYYYRDFGAAWTGLLDNVKLKSLPGEKPAYVPLSVASNPGTSPIKALVEAVVAETSLTAEPPAEESGGLGELADDAAKVASQRLLARTSGLARIGIDFALRKGQARPADANDPRQDPGAAVEAQFRDYAALLQGEPRGIDQIVATLGEIYRVLDYNARTATPSQQTQEALLQAVSNLSYNASRFPPALRRMLDGAVSDLDGDAAGASKARLNELLASDVTRICQDSTNDYYPFAANSRRELPMLDFSGLFAPGGVFDKFFNTNLASLVDRSGDQWVWKKDSRQGQGLSKAALRSFQQAAEIRDAFFAPGQTSPQVTLTIVQESLNTAADSVSLDINGQTVQTQRQGNVPQTIQWPGSMGGGGAVTITFQPEMVGRQSSQSVLGPWALMRVLQRNTFSRRGDTLRVNINVGGRDVVYSVQVGRRTNPFFLPAIEEFTCPTGF